MRAHTYMHIELNYQQQFVVRIIFLSSKKLNKLFEKKFICTVDLET